MHMYDSEINSESSTYRLNNNNNNNNSNNNNNNSNINSLNTNNISNFSNNTNFGNASSDNNILNRIRQDNDGNSASAMSNLYSDPLIDEDHIDDQETINVGNLIIDLESSLEKEKIENEQANSKPTNTCTTTSKTNASASSSSTSSSSSPNSFSSFGTKTNFSTSTINLTTPTSTPSGAKSNQKSSSNKHSDVSSINNAISNTTNSINSNKNTINITSSGSGPGSTTSSNNGHNLPTKSVFKTSADERGELKMRITRETKPGKSEHKIVNSPNQKSPTSFNNNSNSSSSSSSSTSSNSNSGSTNNSRNTIINNSTTSHANNCEDISLHESAKRAQSTSISSTKECGTSTSIGTITEPECLGPCEPGTSVTLEGIVWQETEGGILVVNVTWRGKTYVGALLDSTNHDWAPNRLCDSPASDIDSKANKGVRPKRIVTRSNGIGLDEKNLLQTTGKLRNGKGRRILTSNELAPCNKRQRETEKSIESIPAQPEAHTPLANVSSITNSETACVSMNIDTTTATNNESISTSEILTDKAGPDSPTLIGCSEPNCSKKYRNMNGLLYHQTHAHGTESEPSNTRDSNCSSSSKDKVKNSTKSDQIDFRDEPAENTERLESQSPEEQKQNQDTKPFPAKPEKRRTPSPRLSLKVSNKISNESSPNNNLIINQESIPLMAGSVDQERRTSSNTNHSISSMDLNRRSPLPLPLPPPSFQHQQHHHHHHLHQQHQQQLQQQQQQQQQHQQQQHQQQQHQQQQHQQPPQHQQHQQPSQHQLQQPQQQQQHQPPPPLVGPPRYLGDHGHGSNSHSSSSKQNSSSSKQINPTPLPVTTEEGMKPSGTSTGPPPAPHQANCYFNPSFLAGAFNPYGLPSYFTRPPLPLYDPIAPPTSTANAAFLTRFMNNMRAPPPADSPSRLLSPSMPKNSPFSPFKDVPVGLPIPTSHIGPNSLPNMPPMPNPPPLVSGSPHMRMPSHGDPMLPPNSQPPFLPPVGLGAPLGLPGALNPLGPQVPSLVDDPLAKQFPRRFN